MALVHIVTMGQLRCLSKGRDVGLPARPLLLLTFLVLHPRQKIARDKIADLLWTNGSMKGARHSLSQALYKIRQKTVGLSLTATADYIQYQDGCYLDAAHILLEQDTIDPLRIASLYSGDFLDVLPNDLPAQFHEWRDAVSASCRTIATTKMIRGLRDAYATGEWRTCLTIGDALQKLGALEEPQSEQLAFARKMSTADSEPVSDGAYSTPRFVGRNVEQHQLREHWASVKKGTSKIVVLKGESGIGKTRLANQLARIGAIEGGAVATARCYQAERHIPFAVAFSVISEAVGTEVFTSMSEVLAAGERRDTSPILDMDLRKAASKYVLFDAISRVVREAAAKRPILLWLDDIQWCDESTSEWLHYFLRTSDAFPCLLLLCMRDDDAGGLAATTWLNTADALHTIDVGALSDDESAELVQATSRATGVQVSEERAHIVMKQSRGHPFFLVALTRDILGKDESTGVNSADRLPRSVQRMVAHKFQQLSSAAQTIAQTLAAASSGLDIGALSAATGLAHTAFSAAMKELDDAKLIKPAPLDLAHDLVKQAIYELTPEIVRQVHHRQLFAVLSKADASTLAFHASRAGMQLEAHLHAGVAVGEAKRVYAYGEALYFQKMVASNAPDPLARKTALIDLVDLLTQLDRQREATEYLGECRALCAKYGDSDGALLCDITGVAASLAGGPASVADQWEKLKRLIPLAVKGKNEKLIGNAMRLALHLKQYIYDENEVQRVFAVVERMSATLSDRVRADFLSSLCAAVAFYDPVRAVSIADEAVALGALIDEPSIRIRTTSARGTAKLLISDMKGALEDFSFAESLATDALGEAMFQAYTNKACILFDQGHFLEARRANQLAMRCGSRHHLLLFLNEATGCRNSYDLENCLAWVNRTLTANTHLAAPWIDVATRSIAGLSYFDSGRISDGVAQAEMVTELLEKNVVEMVDWSYTTMLLSRLDISRGKLDQARCRLTTALKERYANEFSRSRMELELATLLLPDDPDLAYAYASSALGRATKVESVTLKRHAQKVLAEIRNIAP